MKNLPILVRWCVLLAVAFLPKAIVAQVHLQNTPEGWQIVADEDVTLVLAYGEGTIDPAMMPAPMAYMMAQYAEALSTPGSATAYSQQQRQAKRRVTYSNVGPLVKTHWAQDAPFNGMCPEHPGSGGRICLTGCVATAMAQVLYYHRLPTTCSGYKVYGLTLEKNRVRPACDFASIRFRWNQMQETYTSSSTEEQRHAVAELMYACGVAASMNYTYKLSTADPYVAANGINTFFDGVSARVVSYSAETVMNELRAGRPVLYSGANGYESHCFVIDGATSDGYFHCNLGHGGSGDGNYLPTNVGGYPSAQNILLISPTSGRTSCTPMSELRGKYATASHTPATSIEANRWYILWNSGRAGSPYSSGVGKTVMNTGNIPSAYGEPTTENACQLVRFVPSGNGYYIQTGLGDYLGSFSANGGTGVTTSGRSTLFTTGTIKTGYFWLRCGSAYIDTNGIDKTMVGWSTTAPTDTLSNSAWRLYPVTITDAAVPARFNSTTPLTLRNTGYSMGYLVATSATDEHPTLRGVTKDHANGLYNGAQYHSPADLASTGARWRITTVEGKQYLYNLLTQKYLTNSGDRTSYVFTSTPTPIRIAPLSAAGTYSFNSGSQAESYLCAATNLANPAAFWTVSDEGSQWLVEEAVDFTPVQGLTLSASQLSMMCGQTQQLVATVQPASATVSALEWSSSNAAVASVDASGIVTAHAEGTAVISVSPQGNSAVRATCSVSVSAAAMMTGGKTSLAPTDLYVLRCKDTQRGYLVATSTSDSHPTLRGVAVGSSVYSATYCSAANLSSPLSQWQIVCTSYDNQRDIYLATIRNVGTGLYLSDSGKSTPYVFSSSPVAITILGSASDFWLRGSALNYLTAEPTRDNPAYFNASSGTSSTWNIYKVGETAPPVGLTIPVLDTPQNAPAATAPLYDLLGHRVSPHAVHRGVYIQQGKKILR